MARSGRVLHRANAGRLTKEKKRFDKDRSAEVLRNMIERHEDGERKRARSVRRTGGARREGWSRVWPGAGGAAGVIPPF